MPIDETLLAWVKDKQRAYEIQVPAEPSQEQIKYAVALLAEAAREFPFEGEADSVAWFAALLTCFARDAIQGPCPMFAVEGTAWLTRSWVPHAASRMVFGKGPLTLGEEHDLDKELISELGVARIVFLENVTHRMCCDRVSAARMPVEQIITSTEFLVRPKGSNNVTAIENRAVWFSSGRGLLSVLPQDLARRTLVIRAKNEDAHSMMALIDRLAWIGRERPCLIGAAMTILRGYAVAGGRQLKEPGKYVPWGSFEAWCELMDPLLRWLGMGSFTVSRVDLRGATP